MDSTSMTVPARPHVDCELHHASLPVSDVLAAANFCTKKLGFSLGFTWGDPPGMAGAEFQRANGVEIVTPPEDRPYGLRNYGVRDLYTFKN